MADSMTDTSTEAAKLAADELRGRAKDCDCYRCSAADLLEQQAKVIAEQQAEIERLESRKAES